MNPSDVTPNEPPKNVEKNTQSKTNPFSSFSGTKLNQKKTGPDDHNILLHFQIFDEKSNSNSNSNSKSKSAPLNLTVEEQLDWLTRCIFALELQMQSLQGQIGALMTSQSQQFQRSRSHQSSHQSSQNFTGSQSNLNRDSSRSDYEECEKSRSHRRRQRLYPPKYFKVIKVPRRLVNVASRPLKYRTKSAQAKFGSTIPMVRAKRYVDHDIVVNYTCQTQTKTLKRSSVSDSASNSNSLANSPSTNNLLPKQALVECDHLGKPTNSLTKINDNTTKVIKSLQAKPWPKSLIDNQQTK